MTVMSMYIFAISDSKIAQKQLFMQFYGII